MCQADAILFNHSLKNLERLRMTIAWIREEEEEEERKEHQAGLGYLRDRENYRLIPDRNFFSLLFYRMRLDEHRSVHLRE